MRLRLLSLAAALVLALPNSAVGRAAPESFADLSASLLPTVVNIATSQTLKGSGNIGNLPQFPQGSPLQDLFKEFLKPNQERPRHVTSLGSGFVIDPSGLIVTNNHVVESADQITVTLNNGDSYTAKLIGRDEKTDLALLKINPRGKLAAAKFGDSDKPRVGDWVIAIGNPFGLGSTVTAGIVSARNRDISAGPYDDFIQTDAPINRGNSGGPLFDMNGHVVGVNSAIFSPTGGSVGIAFSIPSNLARAVISQLKQFGKTRRGWVGVRIQPVTRDIAEGLNLPSTQGALVAGVTPNGPAARAGLRNGDLILSFDGKRVDSRTLPRSVAGTPIGKTVNIDYFRNGRKQTAKITVAKLNDGPAAKPQARNKKPAAPARKPQSRLSRLGLSLAGLNGQLRGRYRIPANVQGAVIVDVNGDSPAAQKNLRIGDVIMEVQNATVRTPDDVAKRVDAIAKGGKKIVAMLINRGGDLTYVALPLN